MKSFVLLVCIGPSWMGCDLITRDYFETVEQCYAALHEVKARPQDVVVCTFDPEHKK